MAKGYAFASGEIGVCSGEENEPEGSVVFAEHEDEAALWRIIEVRARLAHDGKTYLVPGVPEAESQKAAMDALIAWEKWAFQPGWDDGELVGERKNPADFVRLIATFASQQGTVRGDSVAFIAEATAKAVEREGFYAGSNRVFDVRSSIMITASVNGFLGDGFDPVAHLRRIADDIESKIAAAKAGKLNAVACATITCVLGADALHHVAPAGSA
jgi:hypothetical protein